MKVLIVVPSLDGGGAERVLSILSKYFVENKFEVTFLLTINNTIKYTLNDKINIVYNNFKKNSFGQIKSIRKELKSTNYDYLISFFGFQSMYSILASIGINTKIIISERNDPSVSVGKRKFIQFIRNFLYGFSYKVVFQTKDALNCYPKRIRKKGIIIFNPIDTSVMPEWNGYNSWDIITVNRLVEQKNTILLIDAVIHLHSIYPLLKLKIFGDGPLKDYLEAHIQSNNASSYIKLMGRSKNIFDEYKNAFIFSLPSNSEGLSNAMLEALVIGTPTICTDCPIGGAKMFIEEGYNGFLINMNDKEALINKISFFIENRNFAKQVSMEARKTANLVDSKTIVKQWIDIMK